MHFEPYWQCPHGCHSPGTPRDTQDLSLEAGDMIGTFLVCSNAHYILYMCSCFE